MAEVAANAPRGEAKEKRDAAIFDEHKAGKDGAEIGKKHGLSGTRVLQIVNEQRAKRGHRKSVAAKPVVVRGPRKNGSRPTKLEAIYAENESQIEKEVAYVYGRIESQLEVYAANLGIPFTELASGISGLLRDKASGKVFRPHNRVPGVR